MATISSHNTELVSAFLNLSTHNCELSDIAEKHHRGCNSFTDWAEGTAKKLLRDSTQSAHCVSLFYESVNHCSKNLKKIMKVMYKVQKDPHFLRFLELSDQDRLAVITKICRNCLRKKSSALVTLEINALPPTRLERRGRCGEMLSLKEEGLFGLYHHGFQLFPELNSWPLEDVEFLCKCLQPFPLQEMRGIWKGKFWLEHLINGVLRLPKDKWCHFSKTLSAIIDLDRPYYVHDVHVAAEALFAAKFENWSTILSLVTLMASDIDQSPDDPVYSFNKTRTYLTNGLADLTKQELDALQIQYLSADVSVKQEIRTEKSTFFYR